MNAIEYLFGLEFHGRKFGLDGIRALTNALGRPQETYPILHVAGTNGKGSVCAMAATALQAAGYRTGCYTSPHLIDLEERFQVDGLPLPREAVEAAVDRVRHLADAQRAAGLFDAPPTFFEVATAAAFDLFRRAEVDVAVVEVGLGGRLDATNVARPLVGVITTIDLEHQQYLGETLEEIAAEKAGIIKAGMTIVSGESREPAASVIRRVCVDRDAALVVARDGAQAAVSFESGRTRLALTTPRRRYPVVTLGLRGRHQVDNAVVAVRALEALDATGLTVDAAAIATGLGTARWPGRLDEMVWTQGRRVLLDAAHNPAGARTLASYLAESHPAGVPLVLGAVRDKDHRGMLAELLPRATGVVVTEPPTPRAMPAADLAAVVRDVAGQLEPGHRTEGLDIQVDADPASAIERAFGAGEPVCVAGSLFLIGAVLSARRSW